MVAVSGDIEKCHHSLTPFQAAGSGAQALLLRGGREAEGPAQGTLHDWASHAADAFRTVAVMIREPQQKKEQEKRRTGSRLSPWS